MMKKIMKLFVFVAATAMTLASCQRQEIENPISQDVEYTFLLGDADDVDGKALIGENNVVWELGDKLGTFTTSDTPTKNGYSNVTATDPATFSVYAEGGLAKGVMLYFYYPYNENSGKDMTSVTLTIPTSQDCDDDMPMVSLPFEVTDASNETNTPYAGQIYFANLGAIAEFNVFSTNADYQSEKVESVAFTVDGETALAGSFTFNLTAVNYSNKSTLAIDGYTEKSVVASIAPAIVGDSSDAAKVNMVVAPGTYTGTVVVETDKASYTFSVNNAKEFVRSAVKPLAVDLAKGVRVEKTVEPEPENAVTSTISFATDDQRTAFSTLQQVWKNEGVIFTNTKTSGSADVVDNTNPVRLYKNSEISISADGLITKIVFLCNTEAYANDLSAAISGSTKNSKTVSVDLDGTSDAVTYVLSVGQVRLDALTVEYAIADPTAPSITVGNVTGVTARGVASAELTYKIDNLEYSDLTVTCDEAIVTSASKGEDGVINYVVSANSTTSARDGSITISAGTLTKEVKVSQLAPVFTVSKNAVVLGATADSQTTVTVTSDFGWTATIDGNGLTVSPESYIWDEGGSQSVEIAASSAN